MLLFINYDLYLTWASLAYEESSLFLRIVNGTGDTLINVTALDLVYLQATQL